MSSSWVNKRLSQTRDFLSESSLVRWLTGTSLGRLLLLTTFGVIVLLATSAVAYWLDVFPTFGKSVWSGIIHFITPSAISNDQSTDARIVGVVQAIAGLVFYAGVLLAVLSQGVANSLDRLASYEAPLRVSGHIVFLGGYHSLEHTLRALDADLVLFKEHADELPNEVVVVIPRERSEDREHLQERWNRKSPRIKVRAVAGDLNSYQTLRVAAAHRAAKIVISTQKQDQAALSEDFECVQTLHSLLSFMDHSGVVRVPPIFVTMRRARHAESFVDAPWVKSVHVIAQDRSLGARLRLAVLHPAFSAVFGIGTEKRIGAIDVVERPGQAGKSFADVRAEFSTGLALGVVRSTGFDELELTMPPHSDYTMVDQDMIAVMWNADEPTPAPPMRNPKGPLRLLVIGWGPTTRELLVELAKHNDEIENITLVTNTRGWRRYFSAHEIPPNITEVIGNSDYPNVLEEAIAQADPQVIVVASEYSEDTELEDARTTFSALHIRKLVDLSVIPVFTLVTAHSARHLFEESGMLVPNSSVDAHAQNTAIAVSRYRAGRVVRDIFGGNDVGELQVVYASECLSEMNLPEGQLSAKFSEVYDYLVTIAKAPLAIHLKSGLLWAPAHADLEVTGEDRILVVQHGYGSLTDNAL